jgi:hypothetical protein
MKRIFFCRFAASSVGNFDLPHATIICTESSLLPPGTARPQSQTAASTTHVGASPAFLHVPRGGKVVSSQRDVRVFCAQNLLEPGNAGISSPRKPRRLIDPGYGAWGLRQHITLRYRPPFTHTPPAKHVHCESWECGHPFSARARAVGSARRRAWRPSDESRRSAILQYRGIGPKISGNSSNKT